MKVSSCYKLFKVSSKNNCSQNVKNYIPTDTL